jgi:hypothetical protein
MSAGKTSRNSRLKSFVCYAKWDPRNLNQFVSGRWSLEEIQQLVSLIKTRLTVAEIAKSFPTRTEYKVKNLIVKIVASRIPEIELREPRAPWTTEETQVFLDLISRNFTQLDIALVLGRSKRTIENKILNSGLGRKVVGVTYDWELFLKQKFLQVPVSEWPAKNVTNQSKSLFFFVFPDLLTSPDHGYAVKVIRGILLQAEESNTVNINIWVIKDQAALNDYLVTAGKPQQKSPPELSPEFQDLLIASLLADGGITTLGKGSNKIDYRFQFVQAASFIMNTAELQSHLEYVLWFYSLKK